MLLQVQLRMTMFLHIIVCFLLISSSTAGNSECDSRCKCVRNIDGSYNVTCRKAHLKDVPHNLPSNIFSLNLNDNDIHHLTNESFGDHFISLKIFSIEGNQLQTIEIDAFNRLLLLESVSLSYNSFPDKEKLWMFLCQGNISQHIEQVRLAGIGISVEHMAPLLRCLHKYQIKILDISHNYLKDLPDFCFVTLSYIRVLYLEKTSFSNPKSIANLPHLEQLHLRDNHLNYFPKFVYYVNGTQLSMVPSLKILVLRYNNIGELPMEDIGLQNLQSLNLWSNKIRILNQTALDTFAPHLETLNIGNNHLIDDKIQLNSTRLKTLRMINCGIKFLEEDARIFWNLPNLEILNVNQNYMNAIDTHPKITELFFKNTNLKLLDLSHTRMNVLHPDIFKNLHNLERLYLSANGFSRVDKRLFINCNSLKKLDLSTNKLTNINQSTLPAKVWNSLEKLNLHSNPFNCDCDLRWFLTWYNKTSILVNKQQPQSYKCNTPPLLKGKFLIQYHPTEAECTPPNMMLIISMAGVSGLVFIILLCSLMFKYRWHIRYMYFLLRARRRQYKEIEDNSPYIYDAFVIYNKADVDWVTKKLIPKLEELAEMGLCIHDRDWIPGIDIVDNIVESIENSRKVLVVVSNASAVSQWCQLEMTMAQHKLLENDRNSMIMVALETIKKENITPRLALQMKVKTYISWTENEVGQKLFWKRLYHAMEKPTGSLMHSPQTANPILNADLSNV